MTKATTIKSDGRIERSSNVGRKFITPAPNTPPRSFLFWQSQSSNDPLEIVRSVVLDFDSPALFAVMNCDVSGQMLLQPILQILDCRRRNARIDACASG